MIYKEITGRLGNQMFQYAAVKAYKKKHKLNDEIILDFEKLKLLGTPENGFCDQLKEFNTDGNYKSGKVKANVIQKIYILIIKVITYYLLKNKENRIYKFQKKIQKMINKKGIYFFSYGYYNFELCKKKNKLFYGDFESKDYFDFIREDLIKDFTPKHEPLKQNEELYRIANDKNSVCISIRRGDFITDSEIAKKHLVCTEKYYYDAVKLMEKKLKNPKFIIFSDDVDWCKKNMDFPKDSVYETDNNPVWEKLRLMYSCNNFIISNSTFSWWAQYLSRNSNKIVIAPNKWKNYSYRDDRQFDIYEDTWELINV